MEPAKHVFRIVAADTGELGWTVYVIAEDEVSALRAALREKAFNIWTPISIARLETIIA